LFFLKPTGNRTRLLRALLLEALLLDTSLLVMLELLSTVHPFFSLHMMLPLSFSALLLHITSPGVFHHFRDKNIRRMFNTLLCGAKLIRVCTELECL
jgi:hypothetical protein